MKIIAIVSKVGASKEWIVVGCSAYFSEWPNFFHDIYIYISFYMYNLKSVKNTHNYLKYIGTNAF